MGIIYDSTPNTENLKKVENNGVRQNLEGELMQLKALTATLIAVVFASVFLHTPKAHAQSQTTTNNNVNTKSVNVAPGDSLSLIAGANNTTYIRLFDANQQISNPDLIYPGEAITIPSSTEQLPDRWSVYQASTVTASSESTNQQQDSSVDDSQPSAPTSPALSTGLASVSQSSNGSVWAELAQCESGGNWSINSGNGFYGGLQFSLSSWQSAGGTGYPNQASEAEQIAVAQILQSQQGWSAWPVCSLKLGL